MTMLEDALPEPLRPNWRDRKGEWWWPSPNTGQAIVSNHKTGHDCASNMLHVGGHMVCESVPPAVRLRITAVPCMERLLVRARDRLGPSELGWDIEQLLAAVEGRQENLNFKPGALIEIDRRKDAL